ncbi:MAG: DUF3536 domain-containing protein [Chloroflexi bacterium]|nr:DUF3536 domain-containing protein [Chloroflexota bacterium]
MERYVCIHGHFYQPPRENAWLEDVEMQDSAYPHHDWNERVTAESYAPNTASRILDSDGFIRQIVNNYTKISFNFGPTLLSWLEKHASDIYQTIIEADRRSRDAFSGHGSALAQAYNHIIMPLANRRDKYTQILWGIRDFEFRFGRKPEGMWLPETAVDIETLDIMAEQGIKFTILAPHQAKRLRRIGTRSWNEVPNATIDPTMPYELRLASGRKISLFFYNGAIAHDVAFGDILKSGENFALRLTSSYSKTTSVSQLLHIATDGETFGHHHRFGDMALAYALNYIETRGLAQITNYGEYLAKYPPTHQVEIVENTSWSCSHGVERWRSNCGCNVGSNPKWNQEWRAPLRQTLDWLRNTLASRYEKMASGFLKDPWTARNDYIDVILDRSPDNVHQFLERHSVRELKQEEIVKVLKLLELQRHAMLMYSSCGWFFDELSGIETLQIIQYAGRTVQLAQELFGEELETDFLERLEQAKSNIPERGNGRTIYEKWVKPVMVDLTGVTAHFAVHSLFEKYEKHAPVYCYQLDIEDCQEATAGKDKLIVGKVKTTSMITRETANLSFSALHLGGHNVNARVGKYEREETYQAMLRELKQAFSATDFPAVNQLMDKHFGTTMYSFKDLFHDAQHKILDSLLDSALAEVDTAYYKVYQEHYPPTHFLKELGRPVPKGLHSAAEFVLNKRLATALSNAPIKPQPIKSLLEEARTWKVELDNEGLSYWLQNSLEKMMSKFVTAPEDVAYLKELLAAISLTKSAPFPVDLWKVQSLYYQILQSTYPELQKSAQSGNRTAMEWLNQFVLLGRQLTVRIS